MKILCGTDFSDAAVRAAGVAGDLAARIGGKVVLAHVFELPLVSGEARLVPGHDDFERQIREGLQATLEEAAEPLRARGIDVETAIVEGSPARTLAGLATEVDAELVIVGAHGRSGMERLLGSITDRLVVLCDRPVLAVRGETGGVARWARGEGPLSVVAAVDTGDATRGVGDWLRRLRNLGPCEVRLVHLYWPPAAYQNLGLGGVRSWAVAEHEVVRALQASLADRLGDLEGEGAYGWDIAPSIGDVGEAVRRRAEAAGADLVITGTHRRRAFERFWYGSVSRAILRESHATVLSVPTVPAPAEERPASETALPHFNSLLVATDLSPSGNEAMRQALGLLRPTGGVIDLCHIVESGPRGPMTVYTSAVSGEAEAGRVAQARAQLEALVPDDVAAWSIAVRVHVVEGEAAASTVVDLAQRFDADAIVVGTHGRGALARAVLGSVATKIVQTSDRPVWVARRPAEDRR
jgi:nucleotide-binding universal stress UspA family protein